MMLQALRLLPGDEILSINGRQVEGMTDMEALALLAKAGPTVLLEVVKHAFLWRGMWSFSWYLFRIYAELLS